MADQYRKKSTLYKTKVLLVPLGDDFRWDTEKEIKNQFTNYFKLIDYINSHPAMKMHVSVSDHMHTYMRNYGSSTQVGVKGHENCYTFLPPCNSILASKSVHHVCMQVQFGTLHDYSNALHQSISPLTVSKYFPSLAGDFFTYADRSVYVQVVLHTYYM